MQVPPVNMDNTMPGFLSAFCDSVKEGAAVLEQRSQNIIFCNRSWLKMFGFDSMQECTVTHLCTLRKTPLTNTELHNRLRMAEQWGVFTEQVEYLPKKGDPFWGELTIRALNNNESGYYLFVIEQISKAKQEALRIAWDKERSNALLEHASMGIIETNGKAEIVNVNPFVLKLFGYEKNELLKKKIELLIPVRFHSKHIKNREDYIQHPRNRPMGVGMDLYAIKKDGTEFPVEVSLSSYHYNGNKNVIAFVSDISIRKQAETEIKKLNDDLEDTVELRTHELTHAIDQLKLSKEELSRSLEKEKELNDLKTKFVSTASHEFRTPLSTVLSSAYLLQKYTTTDEQQKREKHLQRIISSVNMLTDILNDFLSVGKIEEGKIHVRAAEFDIREFIDSVIEEIQNNFRKRQKIQYDHQGNTKVILDASLLKHIVLNLVSNASKFSPEASIIEIKTESKNGELTLSVKDQGIGISPEDQKHLMERFFRGTNATNIQGTGLGLHIVAKYAELLNGTIKCKSELNKGTEFLITFEENQHEKDPSH